MMARLEIGEVLLTASINEIEMQIVFGVVPRNVAAGDEIGESIPGGAGKFAGLSKWKDPLRVEGDRKFASKTRFDLGNGESETARHGFGNIEMKSHGTPADSILRYSHPKSTLCRAGGHSGKRMPAENAFPAIIDDF
jgi:hypothetical protein